MQNNFSEYIKGGEKMGMFTSLNIAGSGLTAQRFRLDVIANNIANVETTRTTEGGPYQRQRVILMPRDDSLKFKSHLLPEALQPGQGAGVKVVKVEKDNSPPRMVYDPSHPDAIKHGKYKGYVLYPNVNIVQEMVDMISASRSFQTNVDILESAKTMMQRIITLGQ